MCFKDQRTIEKTKDRIENGQTPIPEITAQGFRSTLLSHGWFSLKPFKVNQTNSAITIPYVLPFCKGIFRIGISADDRVFLNVISGEVDAAIAVAHTCLSLDIDLTNFHQKLKHKTIWRWIEKREMGRFLRSPSLFEDCFKVILTTNTNFDRTVKMVESAVEHYGDEVAKTKTFPSPNRILSSSERELRRILGCGFRARYLLDLCEKAVSSSNLYLGKGWEKLTAREFYDKLLSVLGLGTVSAGYLSRMYGKPIGYSIDSWVQKRCKILWGVEKEGIESFVIDRYQGMNGFGPLVFWLELTKHWHLDHDFYEDGW